MAQVSFGPHNSFSFMHKGQPHLWGIQAVNELILEAFPAEMLIVRSPRETSSGTFCTVLIKHFEKYKEQTLQTQNRANQCQVCFLREPLKGPFCLTSPCRTNGYQEGT